VPRKSVAEIVRLGPKRAETRLSPRSGVSPEVKLIFTEIVGSVSAAHFRPTDGPLVEQYAQSIALARQAYAHLDEEGPVLGGKANAWLVVLEKAHRSSVALSMRLRLSPQSRLDRKAVGRAQEPDAFDVVCGGLRHDA
jgi:hypothetical protein